MNRMVKGTVVSWEHSMKVFTRLVVRGQTRAALRWLTDRNGGGVLYHSDVDGSSGKSVLKSKHPQPGHVGVEAFVECC